MMVAILTAMRANAQATIEMIDALLASVKEVESPVDPAACEHPSEARTPLPTMGAPHRFRCTRCGSFGGDPPT